MVDDKTIKARKFVLEVKNLAQKYGLPYFIVTDGASAIDNWGCEAVDHARAALAEWEHKNGIGPDHNWSDDITG